MGEAVLRFDIEAGALSPRVIIDSSVREAVAGILRRPDPELARFVRDACCTGEWAGIVPRIWPNARYLEAIVTGAMAQYVPALEYYAGGRPLVSISYASSECYFGINLQPLCNPDDVSYTIMPNMGYCEFLPVDEATGAASCVDAGGPIGSARAAGAMWAACVRVGHACVGVALPRV